MRRRITAPWASCGPSAPSRRGRNLIISYHRTPATPHARTRKHGVLWSRRRVGFALRSPSPPSQRDPPKLGPGLLELFQTPPCPRARPRVGYTENPEIRRFRGLRAARKTSETRARGPRKTRKIPPWFAPVCPTLSLLKIRHDDPPKPVETGARRRPRGHARKRPRSLQIAIDRSTPQEQIAV